MPTIVFACAGESPTEPNATTHWSATLGTVTKSTTHVKSGANALKMLASDNARVTHTLTAGQRGLVASFLVWIPSTPTGNNTILQWNDGVSTRALYRDPDTFIYMDFGQSTLPFPLDQWVTIDIKLDTTANPHVWDWKINGVAQTQKTRVAAASDIVNITFRAESSGLDTWFDNVAISYTAGDYPIPTGSVGYNGSAEVWVQDSTLSGVGAFAQAAATWAATATQTVPATGGGPSVGGLAYIGRLSPKQRRQAPVTDVVTLPEPEPVLITASAAFSQRPATWAAAMTHNDDELALEMLLT